MERFRFQGGRLFDGLRALKLWRRSTKKPGRKVDRRNHWDIPVINPGESVPQQQLSERADRLRGAADEAARLAQTGYVSFLLLGTYIAVIIGSTTDVQLLKVSPVTLPLLNVQLPIVGFYVVAPWLLLLIYFNLLLHLTFLAQRLHRFNAVLAVFPDDIAREEQRVRLFPFPFSALLSSRPARWRLRILLDLMVLMTVVLLPLLLLLWAQVRFLPYHDTAITWNHRAAVLVYLILLWLFWPLMLPPVQRTASALPSCRLWRVVQHIVSARRFRWETGLIGLTLVTVVFSLGIAVLPEEGMEGRMVSLVSHLPGDLVHSDPARADKDVFKLTFWLFEMPGAPFHRNLQLKEQVLVAGEPAAEVMAALRSNDETKRAQGLEKITGLNLSNRDLRGADLRRTLFPKVDLRGANLKGADLTEARVFAGDLSPLMLSKGDRCVGIVQESENLLTCRTNFQGAYLGFAQLQGAYLEGAQLQGAALRGAQLQGANLEGAHIGNADFSDADLTWSDLRGLRQSPLDQKTYEELEKQLTDVISNKSVRAVILNQTQQPTKKLSVNNLCEYLV